MQKTLTSDDFKTMRQAGKIAAAVLKKLRRFIRPGISTKDIETFFDRYLEKYPGMEPAFKGYSGYPASICVSINDEVIHGIPSTNRVISDGDVVSVDLGIKYKGLFVDTAYTYLVGNVSDQAKRLTRITRESLQAGIKNARPGNKIGMISSVVQNLVEHAGFSVIRKFVGHGIGHNLHVPPEVPNFGTIDDGDKLTEGCAIAIEPMVCAGAFDVEIMTDGWTAKTKDKSIAAHFEHTVAITPKGPWVITR